MKGTTDFGEVVKWAGIVFLTVYIVQNVKKLFRKPDTMAEQVGSNILRIDSIIDELIKNGKLSKWDRWKAKTVAEQLILFNDSQGVETSSTDIKKAILDKFEIGNTYPGWSGSGDSW